MNASYGVRLIIQCLDSFLLAHLLFSALLLLFTPAALWCSSHVRAAFGVWLVFFLRLLPVFAGVYVALAIALPSYVRLEPDATSERIGTPAILIAIVSICLWLRPLMRSAAAIWKSQHFVNWVQGNARRATIGSTEAWLVSGPDPQMAVAGLMRPRVLVSESLAQTLTAEELQIALLHETAHERSRDNLKRLFLLLLPDPFPFVSFAAPLERAWTRLVEWAADDYAAEGDSGRRILLARTLVRFARYKSRAAGACVLTTSLVDDSCDLAVRVERLLEPQHLKHLDPGTSRVQMMLGVILSVSFASTAHFANLPQIHRVLEFLSHCA